MSFLLKSSLLLTILGIVVQARHGENILIPSNCPTTRPLVQDAYGYSLEPVWVADYVSSNLTTNLMQEITGIIGKPPPWRVGGNTADQTYLHLDQTLPSIQYPNATNLQTFNVSVSYFQSFASYFPTGTDFIYTLNFRDTTSAWSNALLEAKTVSSILGSKLKLLELGNEIDHWMSKGWRPSGWDVAEYIPQWRNLTSQILTSTWYTSIPSPPKFQAAVFADPPWVPDQQDEIDDFDIINVTAGGLVDPKIIESYSVHLYPQSTCDTARWYRMRLDLLSNHTVLWQNVSQYIPQVAASDKAGSELVLGETNSISCSGKSGISDTFGAALWGVDYVLMAASIGIRKVYFHLGAQSEYSSFVPIPYLHKGENLTEGVRAGFYAHWFVANVVKRKEGGELGIVALQAANESDFSGYGIYSAGKLGKLVFLDMGVWNGTEGLSNPSTLSVTDGTMFSEGTRPVSHMKVTTPWYAGQSVSVLRLNGPGTNAKSLVNVSGVTFDMNSGKKIGNAAVETLKVGRRGVVSFDLEMAAGILLELVD